MEKIKKFINSNNYLRLIFSIFIVFWICSYLSKNNIINTNIISTLEMIEILFIGIVCFVLLVFFNNTFYIIPWILFTPFVFARPFDVYTAPIHLYIAIGLLVCGIIVNIIRFKTKIIFGNYGVGLILLAIAMILGGITIKSDFLLTQILYMAFVGIVFVGCYLYFSSSITVDFKTIARLMTYLGIYLILQLLVYFILQDSILSALMQKQSDVGWGISNNIALMLLFTFPFTLFLSLQSSKLKCSIYLLSVLIQLLGITITYSRGSIISMMFGLMLLIPLSIWKAKDKKSLLITIFSVIAVLMVLILLIYKYEHNNFKEFFDLILKIDWNSLNGRVPIYDNIIATIQNNPIFGQGVFSLFNTNSSGTSYSWGHSTILQTLNTMGLFGVSALIVHMIEKYAILLKKISIWKITCLFAFLLSDIYGMFDVSYYFINYMVVLILVICMIDKLLINKQNGDENVIQ